MIRFAHLSDTHVCKDYSGNQMKDLFEKCKSPADNLKECMETLNKSNLDFILITGDLVHEGTQEDYEYFREITKDATDVPVIYTLGNHDRKEPFYGAMGMKNREGSYYETMEIKGMRIIILDSAVEGKEHGNISEEQTNWLRQVVSENAPEGSILCFHHPAAWEQAAMGMTVSDTFLDIVKNSDIKAVFCGHTHYNSVDELAGIPQITADSMAFGLGFGVKTISFTQKTGYNVIGMDENGLRVHSELQSPKAQAYATFELDALLAAMN